MSTFHKENAVWAIEQGASSLKALQVVREPGSTALVVRAGEIIEWTRESEDCVGEEEAHGTIAEFLEREEVRGCRVAVVLPPEAGLVETAKLPPVGKERLPSVIRFEAQNRLPVALDRLVWDFHLIDDAGRHGDSAEPIEGVLVAARREIVDATLRPYLDAGVKVELCQLGAVALANALSYERSGAPDADAPVALVDVGAAHTAIVLTDGVRLWQRVVPLGSDRFTRALADRCKLAWPKAEALKREPFRISDPSAVLRALRDSYEELASGIDRSIAHLHGLGASLSFPRVRLLGGGLKALGLKSFLRGTLAYKVEETAGPADTLGLPEDGSQFAAVFGACAQLHGFGTIDVNLLPRRPGWIRGALSQLFRSART